MTVRPTSSGQTPRPQVGRAERANTPAAAPRPSEPTTPANAGAGRDDVQISAQARELQQRDALQASGGELPADRLREITTRMNDGHYDRPDVQAQVVRRIARDLA